MEHMKQETYSKWLRDSLDLIKTAEESTVKESIAEKKAVEDCDEARKAIKISNTKKDATKKDATKKDLAEKKLNAAIDIQKTAQKTKETELAKARGATETVLKITSEAINSNYKIPEDLVIYLIGRFDLYFQKLDELTQLTGKDVTTKPNELAKALLLNNKMPEDHITRAVEWNILSRIFCEAFNEAKGSDNKSPMRPEDRFGRLKNREDVEITNNMDYKNDFQQEGFILGSSLNKVRLTNEDISEAFEDILGISEGLIKKYAKSSGIYKHIRQQKKA